MTGSFSNNFNYGRVVFLVLGMGGGISKGYIVMFRGIRVVLKQLIGNSLNCVTLLIITTLLCN